MGEKITSTFQFAENDDLQLEWREAKRRNKVKVAAFIKEKTGYVVSPDAMFDVQVDYLSLNSSFTKKLSMFYYLIPCTHTKL